MTVIIYLFVTLIFCLWCLPTQGQTASPSPVEHFSGVNTRGDEAMGFSHERTTHHFHLFLKDQLSRLESFRDGSIPFQNG
jgi:hypothetical protein